MPGMACRLQFPLDDQAKASLVERGAQWDEVEYLMRQMAISQGVFAEWLGLSKADLRRRRRQKRGFSPVESDQVIRLAFLWSLALEAFESMTGARVWFKTTAFGLGGRVPWSLARSETGALQVEKLLRRIDRGIPY